MTTKSQAFARVNTGRGIKLALGLLAVVGGGVPAVAGVPGGFSEKAVHNCHSRSKVLIGLYKLTNACAGEPKGATQADGGAQNESRRPGA